MMPRPRTLALAVVFGLLLVGPWSRPPAAAQPAAGPDLGSVRAVYDDLLDIFYRPLNPADLINAAWSRLGVIPRVSDQPAPPALGPVPDDREGAFAVLASAYRHYLATLDPGRVDEATVASILIEGMVRGVNERHTAFLPPAGFQALRASLGSGGAPVGLGIHAAQNAGGWLITEVAPGGPADQSGLAPGDLIVAVDGQDVTNASAVVFGTRTGGSAGTVHDLDIDRGERIHISVRVGTYYFPPLESRMVRGDVGYIRLRQFVGPGLVLPNGTEVLSDLDRRLDGIDAAGARGLVLDLRGNGGGDGITSIELLGRFLPEDTLSAFLYDERGHEALSTVAGQMRAVQHPMVVLVDGGSASASELTAAALRETNRALLVGHRTAGALANAFFLPVPEPGGADAGLEVAAEAYLTPYQRAEVDVVGLPVDVEAADTRTAADYRTGRDPQLDAAVAALASAPEPPAGRSLAPVADPAALRWMLAPLVPDAADIPRSGRLRDITDIAVHDFTQPNEWVNFFGPPRDPVALMATVRARGWLGSHVAVFNPLQPPSVLVSIDLYATAAGAADAVATNDFPDLEEVKPSPVQLGEQTAAYRTVGFGIMGLQAFGLGRSITWRRGNAVFTVLYSEMPDQVPVDALVAIARQLDAAAQDHLPAAAGMGTRAAMFPPLLIGRTVTLPPPPWMPVVLLRRAA